MQRLVKREGGQGFLAKAKDSITESLNKWSEMLFGKKKDSDGKEIATELSKELKSALLRLLQLALLVQVLECSTVWELSVYSVI